MIFHYISNKKGTALCGRKIEEKYLSDDWTMVDCKRCNNLKVEKFVPKRKRAGKYAY